MMNYFSVFVGLCMILSAGAASPGISDNAALSSRTKRAHIPRAEAFSEAKLQRREPVGGSRGARSQGQSPVSRPEPARSRSQSPSVRKPQDHPSSPKPTRSMSISSQQRSHSRPSSPKLPGIPTSPLTSKSNSPQHSRNKSRPQAASAMSYSPLANEVRETFRRERSISPGVMSPSARQRILSPKAQSPRAQSPQHQSDSQPLSRSPTPLFVGEFRLSNRRILPPVRLSSGELNDLSSRLQANQQAREQQGHAQIQTQVQAQGQVQFAQAMGVPVPPSQLPRALGIAVPPAQAHQAQRAAPARSPSPSSESDQSERSGGLRSVGDSRESSPSDGSSAAMSGETEVWSMPKGKGRRG